MSNQPLDIRHEATQIADKFAKLDHSVPVNQVEEKLNQLIHTFKVPFAEAKRNVISHFLRTTGIKPDDFYKAAAESQTHEQVNVGDITSKHAGTWIDVRCKIDQIWDSNHEKILQSGIIGDETGTIKFTIWSSGSVTSVEEGKAYIFHNVQVNNWQGQLSIQTSKFSTIEPINETIEVHRKEETMSGAIVNIQNGSGLIKRCPECNRALSKGLCSEHGKVEGKYDLRTKANLDNGLITTDLIAGREITEKILNMTLDQAKEYATQELDAGAITPLIAMKILGKYWTVTGSKVGTNLLVTTIEPMTINREEMIAGLEKNIAAATAPATGGN